MATQYIKYAKKCEKSFFPNCRGRGNSLFWPGGGYAYDLGAFKANQNR